jgi:type II secretory pathway component PulC
MAGAFGSRAVYEINWLGSPKVVTLPVQGAVADYTRSGKNEGVIVEANGVQDVYQTQPVLKKIASSPSAKSGIVFSADGTSVAYAERTVVQKATSTSAFYKVTDWNIKVVHEDGKVVDLGQGFGPQFFTHAGNTYLTYATEKGIRFVNISTQASQNITLDKRGLSNRYLPIVSPDGMHIALPNIASGYALFGLEEKDGIFTLQPITPFPSGTQTVAFSSGDNIFYVVRDGTQMTYLGNGVITSKNTFSKKKSTALPQDIVLSVFSNSHTFLSL